MTWRGGVIPRIEIITGQIRIRCQMTAVSILQMGRVLNINRQRSKGWPNIRRKASFPHALIRTDRPPDCLIDNDRPSLLSSLSQYDKCIMSGVWRCICVVWPPGFWLINHKPQARYIVISQSRRKRHLFAGGGFYGVFVCI